LLCDRGSSGSGRKKRQVGGTPLSLVGGDEKSVSPLGVIPVKKGLGRSVGSDMGGSIKLPSANQKNSDLRINESK
jgi:hypothetical protein